MMRRNVKQNANKTKFEILKTRSEYPIRVYIHPSQFNFTSVCPFKGTGHFFETLSVGSVPGADHS